MRLSSVRLKGKLRLLRWEHSSSQQQLRRLPMLTWLSSQLRRTLWRRDGSKNNSQRHCNWEAPLRSSQAQTPAPKKQIAAKEVACPADGGLHDEQNSPGSLLGRNVHTLLTSMHVDDHKFSRSNSYFVESYLLC